MQTPLLTLLAILAGVSADVVFCNSGLPPGQEPWVEWIAWGLLAIWYRLKILKPAKRSVLSSEAEKGNAAYASFERLTRQELVHLSIIALSTVSASLLWINQTNFVIWAVPLVNIPLIVGTFRLRSWRPLIDLVTADQAGIKPFSDEKSSFAAVVTISQVEASIAISFFLYFTRAKGISFDGISFIFLQLLSYLSLSQLGASRTRKLPGDQSVLTSGFDLLALQVFGLWSLYVVSRAAWLQFDQKFLLLALLRSYSIYYTITLCINGLVFPACSVQATSAVIFTTLQGFGTTRYLIVAMLLSFAALLQVGISLAPSCPGRKKWMSLILILLPVFKFLGLVQFSTHPSWSMLQLATSSYDTIHPMERLVEAGQKHFDSLVASQSKTIEEAALNYVSRYKRRPPPDFDKWFEIAQKEDYILVDEFDTIMETIEPFWGIQPSIIRSRVESLQSAGYVIRWDIKDHKVQESADHIAKWQAEYINMWLTKPGYLEPIPDMTFMISFLDEPRIAAPYDVLTSAKEAARKGLTATSKSQHLLSGEGVAEFLTLGRQNAWQSVLSSCPITSPARSPFPLAIQNRKLQFIDSIPESLDTCLHEYYHTHHGLFASPASMSLTHTLVPLLGQGKPSIFNDILYPSVWNFGQLLGREYDEKLDTEYSLKKDNLYWTGKATGGYIRENNWEIMHRPRMALMTAKSSSAPTTLLRRDSQTQIWHEHPSTYANLTGLFDVRIVDVGNQCEKGACEALSAALDLIPSSPNDTAAQKPTHDPLAASYGSKFVLDMDGNAFSGRYYRVLKSRSCVLKQTIIQEWHDGRLVPWVHFVPISLAATELGEVMRWLVEEEEGRRAGEKIAREGMEWARKTLRAEDMQITMVRLLMELGRVMRDDRDELGYGGI